MAELLLTDAEKAAASWLELDDAALGKVVKKMALTLKLRQDESLQLGWNAAALLLCSLAHEAKADKLTHELTGCSTDNKPFGDWRVTVERVK